ncbi:MAG TPA: flippase-like domain-containing protein, partial [Mycobacteriales bacterium]|nr:flippase-like domain-containing protein [Mycobacteriales bacterium]
LRRSLPGLSQRRAWALNLGGSGVSNVLPFGGAAGIGLNYAMLRSWGYSRSQISAYTAVSNLVVTVAKVAIAATGLVALLTMPAVAGALPWRPTAGTLAAAGAVSAALVAATAALVVRHRRRHSSRLAHALRSMWQHAGNALRRGWHLLTIGGIGYPVLQALLLWLCLSAVGAGASVVAVLVTYAAERLLTLVPLTPGGVGVVETGTVAILVAFGVSPAAAAAGVILFRVFSFLIEIPIGGLIAMAWFAGRRRQQS